MELIIQNEKYELPNDVSEIEKLFELINKQLRNLNLNFSHMIIDDEAVYENYDLFLMKNIDKIKKVEVVCKEMKNLVDDTLLTTYKYLNRGKILIENLGNDFYQKPQEETWSTLSDLFEGIEWLINTQNRIDQVTELEAIIKSYEVWNEYVQEIKKLVSILPDLEAALNQKDHVLMGDLLLYEVLPFFNTGQEKLRFLIPTEETDHVS